MQRLQEPSRLGGAALNASLHYLALESSDPARLASFYGEAMGYRFEEKGSAYVGQAQERRLVFTEGRDKALAGIGYAVPDREELAKLRNRLAAADRTWTEGATAFFEEALTVADPDGNLVSFGVSRTDGSHGSRDLPARIQHAVVASRDPRAIVNFYTDVLGFVLSDNVIDDEGGVRTSFLRCSHEHHSFAVFKADENRLDHHCYETTDWNMIRDWCDRMAAAHIPIKWGPGRHGPGNNLFIFIHDPDGNWVELSAELEHIQPDRPAGAWAHEQRTLNSWGMGLLRS